MARASLPAQTAGSYSIGNERPARPDLSFRIRLTRKGRARRFAKRFRLSASTITLSVPARPCSGRVGVRVMRPLGGIDIRDLLDGQYSSPVRVIGFNTAEG